MSRSVLMLAYHYPPLGGVAVMRVLRFSRYLAEYGWNPIVVCVDGGAGHEPRDHELLSEVPPGVKVERVPCFEPDNYSDSWEIPQQKVVRNLFKLFDKTLFPDDRAFWVRPVVRRVRQLVRKHRPSLIWATAQPWSTLVAGMRAKQATGLPLVLDFRDDWTTSNADFRRVKRLVKEQELEQDVLAAADAVISVTPEIVEALKARRPNSLAGARFYYIPNGFDPAHFADPVEPSHQEPANFAAPFTIVHAGGLYDKRPITPFLDVLKLWFQNHPERRGQVKLILAGRSTPAVREEIAASGLGETIELLGFVSHRQVRQLIKSSSLNLLMIEQVKSAAWLFTGKVFEYLGAGRPILMLGPDPSPLAEMLRQSGLASIASYDHPDQTARILENLYGSDPPCLNPKQKAAIGLYDARLQSGRLAQIFQEVLQS